ncbi:MAG: RDD family protein [bacterium]
MSDGPVLAGRGRRLLATLIDAALVPAVTILLVMITGVVEDAEDYADRWWMVHVLLLAVLSYLLLNGYGLWRRGQTLGKRLLGIAIVPARSTGGNGWSSHPAPLWKLICLRAPFFPLLFLVIVPWVALLPLIDQLLIFGRQRRCLHDYLSGTVVVRLGGGR